MLGSALANYLNEDYNVYGIGSKEYEKLGFNYKAFDLNQNGYDKIIKWSKPNIIIHCAALTNIDYCQENSFEAFNINSFSVKKLIDFTDEDVMIFYISTDAVFPSKLHLAKENDYKSPENNYGKSKELGEFFLLNSKSKYLIIRTTIVGINPNNNNYGLVSWILNSIDEKKSIRLFEDVFFTPITIWDLIKEIKFLMKKKNIDQKILHIAGKEIVSKYQFGISLARNLSLNMDLIQKGKISEFTLRNNRSFDQTLSCELYEEKFKRELPNLNQTIESIIKNI